MVYAGTQTVTVAEFGSNGVRVPVLKISTPSLDADAEEGGSVDSWDYIPGFIARSAVLQCDVAAGTTTAIAIKLQGSFDGTNWFDTDASMTSTTTVVDRHPDVNGAGADNFDQTYRYWKVVCTTVGATNTLNATTHLLGG